tara:strand:- start:101 stop:337 length:237 start_codon:yes stop_codon:yes gene_type:complete
MVIGTRHQLNIELLEAFNRGDKKEIVDIFSRQGFRDLKEGNMRSGFFLITQAYIYALEEGFCEASFLYETLQKAGREK